MSKYLEFKLLEQKAKTKIVEVRSKRHGFKLGTIMWYTNWRQYGFFPEKGTVFDAECLNDIQSYIKEL